MNDEFRRAVIGFILFHAKRPIGGDKSGSAEEDVTIEARNAMDIIMPDWRKKWQIGEL